MVPGMEVLPPRRHRQDLISQPAKKIFSRLPLPFAAFEQLWKISAPNCDDDDDDETGWEEMEYESGLMV